MNYKTQVFTEQQLKDGAKGLVVVTTEPVKKGEYLDVNAETRLDGIILHIPEEETLKIVCEVGEIRQAVNEKGWKQHHCPKCKLIRSNIGDRIIKYWCCDNEDCGELLKPFLFRLEKIERKTVWEKKKDGPKDSWLKSWKVKTKCLTI